MIVDDLIIGFWNNSPGPVKIAIFLLLFTCFIWMLNTLVAFFNFISPVDISTRILGECFTATTGDWDQWSMKEKAVYLADGSCLPCLAKGIDNYAENESAPGMNCSKCYEIYESQGISNLVSYCESQYGDQKAYVSSGVIVEDTRDEGDRSIFEVFIDYTRLMWTDPVGQASSFLWGVGTSLFGEEGASQVRSGVKGLAFVPTDVYPLSYHISGYEVRCEDLYSEDPRDEFFFCSENGFDILNPWAWFMVCTMGYMAYFSIYFYGAMKGI